MTDIEDPGPAVTTDDDRPATALFTGDTGTLAEGSRRALVELVKGPYLDARTSSALWSALLTDEAAVRSRLHELFLELVLDRVDGFAFVRNVQTDELVSPKTVRSQTLTFMDTAMLLVLRRLLLTREGDGRVIVGRDDVFDQLRVYRSADRDELDFAKRMNASWGKMRNALRVVHAAGGSEEDRVEISPVLKLIVDADQVRQIGAEYARLAAGGAPGLADASDDVESSDPSGDETDVIATDVITEEGRR